MRIAEDKQPTRRLSMPTNHRIFALFMSLVLLPLSASPLSSHSEQNTISYACENTTSQEYSQYIQSLPYYTPSSTVSSPTQITSPQQSVAPTTPSQTTEKVKVIRAALDIGSGATKLRVAEVDLKTNKIEKILVNESYSVQYQENLSKSENNTFNEQVMQAGVDAIKKGVDVAKKYNAEKVVAVATASFRKASNSQDLINRIYKETGVKVYVIDQDLEGKLAFNAVMAQENYQPQDLIVWDIGGGSLQLTGLGKNGQYQIYRGDTASINFKNIVIENVQHKNSSEVGTPNPISAKEIEHSSAYARDIAQKVDRVFKDRIQEPQVQVVGVGNIFANNLYESLGHKKSFTQEELRKAILTFADKNDQQIGGGDYANVHVSNLILVLGYMETLGINRMEIVDVNNADGAMLYPDFWR